MYFLGKVSEEEKIRWMQRAWIVVSTSTIEGWGMVITEATACRTPAVAYNVPGLRDSIKDMETGILIEPGNIEHLAKAVTHLLTDHDLRDRLAENAYRHAQQYSWDKTAKNFLEVLNGVLYG